MHCRLYNSIPGLNILDAMASPPVVAIKCLQHCQMSAGGGVQNHSFENQCSNALGGLDEAQISNKLVFLGL